MTLNSVNRIKKIQAVLDERTLTNVAYSAFVQNTPIKSGNARRKTTKTSNEINASYPYAKRLDNGWSKQSPQGMVKPTILAIRDYIAKKLGK